MSDGCLSVLPQKRPKAWIKGSGVVERTIHVPVLGSSFASFRDPMIFLMASTDPFLSKANGTNQLSRSTSKYPTQSIEGYKHLKVTTDKELTSHDCECFTVKPVLEVGDCSKYFEMWKRFVGCFVESSDR